MDIFTDYRNFNLSKEELSNLAKKRGIGGDFTSEEYIEELETLDYQLDNFENIKELGKYEILTYLNGLGFNMDAIVDLSDQELGLLIEKYANKDEDVILKLTPKGEKIYYYYIDRSFQDLDYYDKIKGMLYGGALGDALGAPHEFKYSRPLSEYQGRLIYQPTTISKFQGKREGVVGQWTDDTEMTLALAQALLVGQGYNRDIVIDFYEKWANSKPFGMGKNTGKLFRGVKTVSGYENRYKKLDLTNNQSNGSLMRAAPLALLVSLDDLDTFNFVIEDVNLTNPTPINREASIIYITALVLALHNYSVEDILDIIIELGENSSPEIKTVIDQVSQGKIRDVKGDNKGWVTNALYAALMALRWYQESDDPNNRIRFAYNNVILLGGDTDTNAAIAGSLLGTVAGFQELEREFSHDINIINRVNTALGKFPRPLSYHPIIIPRLTQKLVTTFPKSAMDNF